MTGSIGVGGAGLIGIGMESVAGTYTAPTKFVPILNESLVFNPGNQYRRPIRQTVDYVGVVPGNIAVTGSLSMEFLDDCAVYFMYTMRTGITKSGTGPYTYTIQPASTAAIPTYTMSITVVRNGQVFGYVGCVVSKLTMSITNEILQMDCDILGLNEATESLPSATWPTTSPYGPGLWNVSIPIGTQVFDMDTFTFSVDEAGAAQYRLKNTGPNNGRGAQFISMGERTTQLTATRDFISRSPDYNNFQAGSIGSISITGTKVGTAGTIGQVNITLPAAYMSDYSVPNGTQGDIVRASITYDNTIEGSPAVPYQITVLTSENITP